MAKSKIYVKNSKTAEQIANPYSHMTLNERLVASGAIDLTDNHWIEDLPAGYIRIHPIDPKKLIKLKT